jgi:hypothetical protein
MPLIPEEPIERVEAVLDDLRDAVQAQTQAILVLNERVNVCNEILTKVHEAVTKPAEGDGLGTLLKALVEADKRHAAMLQRVLAAVQGQ